MSLTLFSISVIILINIITNEAITKIQKQIDISVQLQSELSQNEIDIFLTKLSNDPGIDNIVYKSKQEALNDFKLRFKDRLEIISFLERLGQNPLFASINITAKDPSFYDAIIKRLESSENSKYVKEVKGKDEQTDRINRLLSITEFIKKVLMYISFGFCFIALLIILNTIRITIYNRNQEIVIMKLVGATYSFITLPFLVEGILYGLFATLISTAMFFPIIHYTAPFIGQYFGSSEATILGYYTNNITNILLIQASIGSFVGVVSAYLAVHRYLKDNESSTNRE